MIERRIIETDGIDALVPAWRELARGAARSPFETPAWLLPWLRHYGAGWRPSIVTWWRRNDLVGVAPLVWRRRRMRGISVRELEFWGRTATPLRGWVDIVADDAVSAVVAADFATWLARSSADWDLFHYLHLATDSPTLPALTSGRRWWWRVDLSRVLYSFEYDITLPADASGWRGHLGPKARHEVHRQGRLFERRMSGRVEVVTDPGTAEELVTALRSLNAERWGDRDAYFRRDPKFGQFLVDAMRSVLEAELGWVLVARDPQGIAACLMMLALPHTAVATLIGVTQKPEYRPLSLGKCLLHDAIDGAVARGCRRFNFLTEGDYKKTFWRAEARPIESGFVARGAIGLAIAAAVSARRVAPERILGSMRGRQRGDNGPSPV
ncbi:MAG: GNAT family N-acetyltransferase [Chloroflexota bacterium]